MIWLFGLVYATLNKQPKLKDDLCFIKIFNNNNYQSKHTQSIRLNCYSY